MKWREGKKAPMPRSSPATLNLPPFEGTVRWLILANVAVYFAFELLLGFTPGLAAFLAQHLTLQPVLAMRGELWQLFTYSFLNLGFLGIVMSMLTLWFCGPVLEGAYGSRWLIGLYFTSVMGGALLASGLAFTHVLGVGPNSIASGAFAGISGLLIAIAVRMGDIEFWFLIRVRAKYMVAFFVLIDIADRLRFSDFFGILVELSALLSGYLYTRFAPRRGYAFGLTGLTEQYYGLRNAWYRAKRRRAARKFEVYMGKQGRVVSFDKEGRYLDPDEERKNPKDKRWMN
jgi:membrane associated rhomboid family serine protease